MACVTTKRKLRETEGVQQMIGDRINKATLVRLTARAHESGESRAHMLERLFNDLLDGRLAYIDKEGRIVPLNPAGGLGPIVGHISPHAFEPWRIRAERWVLKDYHAKRGGHRLCLQEWLKVMGDRIRGQDPGAPFTVPK